MDEYDHGIEPGVRRYLKKVLNTIFVGLFWMIAMAVLGIFLAFGLPLHGHFDAVNIAFYLFFLISLGALLWYYYRLWK